MNKNEQRRAANGAIREKVAAQLAALGVQVLPPKAEGAIYIEVAHGGQVYLLWPVLKKTDVIHDMELLRYDLYLGRKTVLAKFPLRKDGTIDAQRLLDELT